MWRHGKLGHLYSTDVYTVLRACDPKLIVSYPDNLGRYAGLGSQIPMEVMLALIGSIVFNVILL